MTTDKELKRLEKKWKKSKWHTEEGEKKMREVYKHLDETFDPNYDVQEYFDNIRAGLKSLADFCEGITEARIIEGDITKNDNKEK